MPLTAEDIAEIVNLGHVYNQAVDDHDPDGWTDTFTDDGEVVSPFGNPQGRENLHAWISQVIAPLTGTRHFTLNEVVEGDGDKGTMRSYYFVVGTNDAPPAIGASGSYEDELVKVDGKWRFSKRVHTVDASFQGEELGG